MDRLSRTMPEEVRLARQLKDSGTELYAPDANMLELMEEILRAIKGLPT